MQRQADVPFVKKMRLLRLMPQALVIVVVVYTFHVLNVFNDFNLCVVAGLLVVVGYRYLIRCTFMRHHAKGIRLVKERRFEEAVEAFQGSLAYFERHPSLDAWRSLLFLSPGMYGYRELALLNLGYIHSQIKEGERAEQYYNLVLAMNPHNGVATAAVNMLNAKQRSSADQTCEGLLD